MNPDHNSKRSLGIGEGNVRNIDVEQKTVLLSFQQPCEHSQLWADNLRDSADIPECFSSSKMLRRLEPQLAKGWLGISDSLEGGKPGAIISGVPGTNVAGTKLQADGGGLLNSQYGIMPNLQSRIVEISRV